MTPRHETPPSAIVARKKNCTVTTPRHAPFPMIVMEDVSRDEALEIARTIWPLAIVD
jgi:hypothetical protein